MSPDSRHSVSVSAVVLDHHGRVLVVQRRDTEKWEIPGGVLELSESIPAGLRREVMEETGLLVEPDRLTGIYKNVRLGVVALVFRAHILSGEPVATEESKQVAWWHADTVASSMAEVFAVRVLDAIESKVVRVRMHDGRSLIDDFAA